MAVSVPSIMHIANAKLQIITVRSLDRDGPLKRRYVLEFRLQLIIQIEITT